MAPKASQAPPPADQGNGITHDSAKGGDAPEDFPKRRYDLQQEQQ